MFCEIINKSSFPPLLDTASSLMFVVFIYLIVLAFLAIITLYGKYKDVKGILDKLGNYKKLRNLV